MKKQTTCKPAAPVLHPNANVSLKEQIAQRAHELWLYRGHKHGNDLADWFQAEHEINEMASTPGTAVAGLGPHFPTI